jgi:hypothetical protein
MTQGWNDQRGWNDGEVFHVFEVEGSGAASAYVAGLPVYAAGDSADGSPAIDVKPMARRAPTAS